MPKRLQPTRFGIVRCDGHCSLNPKNLGEERATLVHGWYESGLSDEKIAQASLAAGFRITPSSAGRHRMNHLVDKATEDARSENASLSDVEALEAIIKRGQEFIPTWKITPTEYFKALDLYYKLTKGSAFDGLMSSLAAAAGDLDDDIDEGEPQKDDPSAGDFDVAG